MTWAFAWRVLWFSIPIPLIAIAGVYAWFVFDKHSAVRKAVDKAVTELVAGAQIATLEAQLEASEKVAEFERGVASALEVANRGQQELLETQLEENKRQDDQIEAMKKLPPPKTCEVTEDLLKR